MAVQRCAGRSDDSGVTPLPYLGCMPDTPDERRVRIERDVAVLMDVPDAALADGPLGRPSMVAVTGTYDELSDLARRIHAAGEDGAIDQSVAENTTYSMYLALHGDESAGTVQELRDLAARFEELARAGEMDPKKCRAGGDAIAAACEGRHLTETPLTKGELQGAIVEGLLRLHTKDL